MTLRRPFASILPEFDRFLFATVGEEVDGMPLSVLSALSRLGLDPRDEAARLSDLAGDAAADQLARTIARLPGRRWTSLEMQNIADRLVALLPGATDSTKMDPVTSGEGRKTRSWTSGLLTCLILAAAVLIVFVALGSLSPNSRETLQPASGADPQTSYRPGR
jgi:hypothetical protein